MLLFFFRPFFSAYNYINIKYNWKDAYQMFQTFSFHHYHLIAFCPLLLEMHDKKCDDA